MTVTTRGVAVTTRRHDDRGAALVEYSVLVMLIAAVVVVGATALGLRVVELFESVDLPG
jgi:Flp pilus assembly pilin Flp